MNNCKKVLLLLLCLICCSIQIHAVKATSKLIQMQQPDGTTIQVYLHGDENGSYITTADGYLITKDVDGYLKYTTINKSNEVEITNIIARNKEDRNETDNKFLSSSEMQNKNRTILFENIKRQRIVNNVRDKAILNYQKENQSNPDLKNSISPKFLVILVNFADIKFTYSAQDFHAWLNEPGNDRYGATGSVKDYFLDNSDNYFSPEFDVVGPVDLKYPVIYYGMNSSSYGTDIGAEEMIYEACLKAYSQYGINMADYDNTGNGFVDNINVVFAGYSESSTAIENLIWPHSYYLSWRPQIGNAQIYNYTCSAELLGDSGANIDGMGTFTHEFLHFLGLKDLYDTDGYNNGYGLDPGDYSIMASGNYNNNGRTPPNLMAYERFMLGWGSPVKILNEPEDIILDDISTNSFYAINARPELNDPSIHGMEWFFLENRQRTGWDTYIPAGGLLITHWDFTLDYGYNFWLNNMPNNYSKHRCLYIKCADNVDDILTRNGDTYPGRSGNTEFTPLSYPAAISWTNEDINAPVTNIREENGKILFQVNGGINRISEIKTNVPTGITDQSAKVTATIVYADNEITSTGFCWAKEGEVPTINSESVRIENISDSFNYEITGLNSFTHYRVRSFMELSNGQIIYGASIPFITECTCKSAPYKDDFNSWTDGFLDCWSIVDANKDGTTWVYDKYTEAILYQFDYWNSANDWLISPKILIPENGNFYFTRAIMEEGLTEKIDIMVSTKSRDINDFFLIKKFSLGDNLGYLVLEGVDLSAFEGQEIYIAIVCRSEKMQGAIWLQNTFVTSKLPSPELIKFELLDYSLYDKKINMEWSQVTNAKNYYINIDMVVDTIVTDTKFMIKDDFNYSGNTNIESGKIHFKESDIIETIDYADGITNLMFIYNGSGPTGESQVIIQGTEDGETWNQLGPALRINSSVEYECILSDYFKNRNYRKLRFICEFGGRHAILNYLTIQYNINQVEYPYAGTAVGNRTNYVFDANILEDGYTYLAYVNASDGYIFYDNSNKLSLDYNMASSIINIDSKDDLIIYNENNQITIHGLDNNSRIDCIALNGQIIKSVLSASEILTIDVDGYKGIMILRITGNDKGYIYKILIK